jgi:hypothetical protein
MKTIRPHPQSASRTSLIVGFALVLMLAGGNGATGGEGGHAEPRHPHFLQRFGPVGGWHPDGGGVWHWWNPQCFPRCGGPDDYCRKPPPQVCWPPYRPFYVWGPPGVGHAPCHGFPMSDQ